MIINKIYENVSLKYILDTILHGTFGFEEEVNLTDLIITTDSVELNHVIIKPTIKDIHNDVNFLPFISDVKIDEVETENVNYIVFTLMEEEIEETNKTKTILINMGLTDYILLQNNNDFIIKPIWNLNLIK